MMRVLRWLRARLHALVRRDVVAGEIREELDFHVRMRAEEYERAGEPPAAAARRARRRVGNLAILQDRGYDIRGGGVMETVLQDLKYGARLLWTQRGFSLVAVATLALAIGLSTALWSIIDAAVLHPLPYPHPEQLVEVLVQQTEPFGTLHLGPSLNDVRAMAADSRVFSAVAAWRSIFPFNQPIAEGPEPERLSGYEVTDGYFPLYGVTPLLGRPIESEDTRDGAPPVVVLGYDYWQRRYGGNPDVVGRTIRFNTGSATIVGVMPLTFDPDTPLWRPLTATGLLLQMRGSGTETDARLRSGIGRDQAQGELTDLLARQPSPASGGPVMLHSLLDNAAGRYHTTVEILAGAVTLVLLIACVNVAGLLLTRGATRSRELAIRASIGAGRGRLIRQLLTESLVLATAGGALGVLLAWASLGVPVSNIPMTLPANAPAAMNLRVLAFSGGLTVATGLFFGLLPALRLSRVSAGSALAKGFETGRPGAVTRNRAMAGGDRTRPRRRPAHGSGIDAAKLQPDVGGRRRLRCRPHRHVQRAAPRSKPRREGTGPTQRSWKTSGAFQASWPLELLTLCRSAAPYLRWSLRETPPEVCRSLKCCQATSRHST